MASEKKKEKSPARRGQSKGKSARPLEPNRAAPGGMVDLAALNRIGLRRFSCHTADDEAAPAGAFAVESGPDLRALDAEAAARFHLRAALANPALPGFVAETVNGEAPEFESLGVQKVPLLGTAAVKFQQTYHKIPVYGSLVTVELDGDNRLVAFNSFLGDPANVDPMATVSPAAALALARQLAGSPGERPRIAPRLFYYFDRGQQRWRLTYFIEDMVKRPAAADPTAGAAPIRSSLPPLVDVVIDAHSGELVKDICRVATQAVQLTAADALGKARTFLVDRVGEGAPPRHQMVDPLLNVHTFDFGFRSVAFQHAELPGKVVATPRRNGTRTRSPPTPTRRWSYASCVTCWGVVAWITGEVTCAPVSTVCIIRSRTTSGATPPGIAVWWFTVSIGSVRSGERPRWAWMWSPVRSGTASPNPAPTWSTKRCRGRSTNPTPISSG